MSDETNETSQDDTPEVSPTDEAASTDEAVSTDEATSTDEAASTDQASPTDGRKVVRRTVTSRRVTPKGGAKVEPTSPSKARDAKKTEAVVTRTAADPVLQNYPKGPSPWWVPALMFGLLIVGALIIMLNYAGVFGDPDNIRLVVGLGLILGGIIAATQYR